MAHPEPMQISLSLIHHHDQQRLQAARPAVQALAAALNDAGADCTCSEVTEQASVDARPFTVLDLLLQRIHLIALGIRWRRHCGATWGSQLYFLPFGVTALLGDLLRPTRRAAALRRAFIERAIRHKHEQAWRGCLAMSAQWCLVCEDDIQVRSTATELAGRLASAPWQGALSDLLVLSGSCEPADLELSRMPHHRTAGGWLYRGYVTNGMVCYALHRRLLTGILAQIDRHPGARRLPADWLMNWCLLRLDPNRTAQTYIADPEVVVHGSRDGTFPSLFD